MQQEGAKTVVGGFVVHAMVGAAMNQHGAVFARVVLLLRCNEKSKTHKNDPIGPNLGRALLALWLQIGK
jgi:hypothetical protein